MKILFAEDDIQMQKIVRIYLEKEGYEVTTASDGEEGLAYLCEKEFDLVILDWMMPKKDGITLCKEIRQMNLPVKIILLTAKNTSLDELQGLVAGADDYISKPFDIPILLIRIKKLVNAESIFTYRNLVLNAKTYEVKKDGMILDLTKKEYDLLVYLISNQGVTLTREQLLSHVWGINYEGDTRTVDTHIKRLRKKIGNQMIATKIGVGYTMEKTNE